MAVSGVVLLGFVVTHMIGNLHLYEGPLEIHEYAETLRNLGTDIIPRTWLLWGVRLLLIAAFAVHVHSAYSLKEVSRKSIPDQISPTATRNMPLRKISLQLTMPAVQCDGPDLSFSSTFSST